jgi:hypothetical protein
LQNRTLFLSKQDDVKFENTLLKRRVLQLEAIQKKTTVNQRKKKVVKRVISDKAKFVLRKLARQNDSSLSKTAGLLLNPTFIQLKNSGVEVSRRVTSKKNTEIIIVQRFG